MASIVESLVKMSMNCKAQSEWSDLPCRVASAFDFRDLVLVFSCGG
jgi:hypothetical protein